MIGKPQITPEQMIEWIDEALMRNPPIPTKTAMYLRPIRDFIKQHSAKPVKEGELLSCPFCGGNAQIKSKIYARVECTKCFVITRHYNSDELAEEEWNTRTPASAPKDIEANIKVVREALSAKVQDWGTPGDICWDALQALDRIEERLTHLCAQLDHEITERRIAAREAKPDGGKNGG